MNKDLDFSNNYSSDSLANAHWADPSYIGDKYTYKSGAIWLGRNPHNPDHAIGYKDDRHVFICAETRSGKGRSFMVNNQVLWSGSLITVGPKGEEATIVAERRGTGNEFCDGIGQQVFVLDPMRSADVPDGLRAHFNLLSGLDADDGELVAKTDRIAKAICTIPESAGESAEWAKRGQELVATLILHVKTYLYYDDNKRNILTVRDFVQQGQVVGAKILKEKKGITINPFELLLEEMIENKACRGVVSRRARDIFENFKEHPHFFQSVRGNAAEHLSFLEGEGISHTVFFDDKDSDHNLYPRTFDINELRDSKKGISIFVCLPEQNYDPLDRWLRAMIVLILDFMREKQGIPATGHQVLFSIDEFANLGKMDDIGKAINSIASSGVKLMIAVQRIGDLQQLYDKAWEKFISAAGTQIWFGIEEVATGEYLEKKLGKTEVSKIGRSYGKNTSYATTEGTSASYSHTNSLSNSETQGQTNSKARGESQAKSESTTKSKGTNKNYGSSNSKNSGKNYGPHIFFEDFTHETNYSSNKGKSKGHGSNQQTSESVGFTDTASFTETTGSNQSKTQQSGTSDTEQKGTTQSNTQTQGENAVINETFHVKPLLSALEAKQFLLSQSEIEHPAYPGFALISLADEENPFFVRRANHDQDPEFIRKFNPNPIHEFIPFDEQPLLGWQITPEHFFTIKIPDELQKDGLDVVPIDDLKVGDRVKKADCFFSGFYNTDPIFEPNWGLAPFDFKLIDICDKQLRAKTGEVIKIRADNVIDSIFLNDYLWGEKLNTYEAELLKINEQKRREREQQRQENELHKKRESIESQLKEINCQIENSENSHKWLKNLISYRAIIETVDDILGFFLILGIVAFILIVVVCLGFEECPPTSKIFGVWLVAGFIFGYVHEHVSNLVSYLNSLDRLYKERLRLHLSRDKIKIKNIC